MSTVDLVELAEVKVKAFSAAAEAQVEWLKAQAIYQKTMMEILEKRVEIEKSLQELQRLRDAFIDYQNARRDLLQRLRQAEMMRERYDTATRRVTYLALGEAASYYQCQLGWRAFWMLASRCPVPVVLQLSSMTCEVEVLTSENFFDARQQTVADQNAPSECRSSLRLMDWLRDRGWVPRLSSPAMDCLHELLSVMADGASQVLEQRQGDLQQLRTELLELRQANWRQLEIQFPKSK